jgi:hypothetical protein
MMPPSSSTPPLRALELRYLLRTQQTPPPWTSTVWDDIIYEVANIVEGTSSTLLFLACLACIAFLFCLFLASLWTCIQVMRAEVATSTTEGELHQQYEQQQQQQQLQIQCAGLGMDGMDGMDGIQGRLGLGARIMGLAVGRTTLPWSKNIVTEEVLTLDAYEDETDSPVSADTMAMLVAPQWHGVNQLNTSWGYMA